MIYAEYEPWSCMYIYHKYISIYMHVKLARKVAVWYFLYIVTIYECSSKVLTSESTLISPCR